MSESRGKRGAAVRMDDEQVKGLPHGVVPLTPAGAGMRGCCVRQSSSPRAKPSAGRDVSDTSLSK